MEKLARPTQQRFKKKLKERVLTPHKPASQLRSFKEVYKIKLHPMGYRLVYEVNDAEIVVYVIAAGKRERGIMCSKAEKRKWM